MFELLYKYTSLHRCRRCHKFSQAVPKHVGEEKERTEYSCIYLRPDQRGAVHSRSPPHDVAMRRAELLCTPKRSHTLHAHHLVPCALCAPLHGGRQRIDTDTCNAHICALNRKQVAGAEHPRGDPQLEHNNHTNSHQHCNHRTCSRPIAMWGDTRSGARVSALHCHTRYH